MYAIVEISGKQFKVTKDQKLKVPLLNAEAGKQVNFDRIMALEDDKGQVSFGTPILNNMEVTASIIEHGREKKIIVFKKKRRKGYRKKQGHRQDYSLIEISDIGIAKRPVKTAAKEKSKDKEKKTTETKKASTAKKTKAPVKKATSPKPKTKKSVSKKDTKEK